MSTVNAVNGSYSGLPVKQSEKSAAPAFSNSRVWGSLDKFTNAIGKYESEWKSAYSDSLSQLENNGKVTVDELKKQMLSEFESYGIKFVNSAPKDPQKGQNLVYIDDSNLQKMADDPDYRAQVFSVMQAELVSTKGYNFQQNGGTVSSRLTGTVISISDENPKSRGDVPYSGMARGVSIHTGDSSSGNNANKSKSMLEIIREMHEGRLEKKKAEGGEGPINKERSAVPFSSSGDIFDLFC